MCSTTRRTTTRSSCGPAFQGRAGNRRNESHSRLVKGDEMNDLHYMPATEALKQFKSRKLSPVELVRAVIDRATAVEPAINAFAQTFFDEALTQAKAAETRYAGNGKPARALEGILVAVKEEAPITGHKNTLGSLPLRDTIADHTAVF